MATEKFDAWEAWIEELLKFDRRIFHDDRKADATSETNFTIKKTLITRQLTLVVIRSRKISTNARHEIRPDGAALKN